MTVATASAMALTACGSASNSSGQKGGGSGAVSLKVTTNGTIDGMAGIVRRYETAHPGTTIKVVAIPSNNYQSTVRTELAGGSGPDLMFVWGGAGNTMGVGTLAPTSNMLPLGDPSWANGLPENVKSLYENDGKLYAAPINTYVSTFAYNKGDFKKAGIGTAPATWSQFLADCAKLKAAGITPVEIGNQSSYLNMQVPAQLANDIAYSADPSFGAEVLSGKIKLSTSALWRRAVATGNADYEQLFKRGYVAPNSTATTLNEAIADVASGKAAITDLIAGFNQLSTDNPKGSFGSFAPSASNDPSQTVVTEAPGAAFAINAHTRHAKEAQSFLAYLAQPAQVDALAKASQTFPLVAGATYAPGSVYAGIEPLLHAKKIAQNPTNYFPSSQTKDTWTAQAESIATGQTSAASATSSVLSTLG